MEFEELLDKIGISVNDLESEEGKFIYTIDGSDEFSYMYAKLCKLFPDYENAYTKSIDEVSVVYFVGQDFDLKLNSNFNEDVYTLTIEKVEID